MADINKKINLDVDSNVDKTTKDFEKLNKVIKDTTANFKKFTQVSGLAKATTDLKKAVDQINELNKSLFNLGGMLKGVSGLDTKLDKVAKSMGKVARAASGEGGSSGGRRTYKHTPEYIAKKAVEQLAKEELDIDKAVSAEIKAQKDSIRAQNESAAKAMYANKLKEQEQKNLLENNKSAAVKTTLVNLGRAFSSGSILTAVNALAGASTAGIFSLRSRKQNKMFADKLKDINAGLADTEAILNDPNTSESAKDAASAYGLELGYEKSKIEKEQATYNKGISKRAAAAAAVIKMVTGVMAKFGDIVKSTTGVTLSLKENMSNLIQSIGSITSLQGGAATYASGSTLYTNSAARTQQMKYGLTSSQNYALSKTMSMMGMSSDEDLMYMNRNQVQLFSSMMQKYSSWYDKMESSGVLQNVQEMQMDLQMFREELAMDFMEWFSENKDTILNSVKAIAKFVMNIADVVCKTTGWIGKGISFLTGNSSTTLSDTMYNASSYSNSNITRQASQTTNVNISMNNTATGVLSDQAQMEEFFSTKFAESCREAIESMSK